MKKLIFIIFISVLSLEKITAQFDFGSLLGDITKMIDKAGDAKDNVILLQKVKKVYDLIDITYCHYSKFQAYADIQIRGIDLCKINYLKSMTDGKFTAAYNGLEDAVTKASKLVRMTGDVKASDVLESLSNALDNLQSAMASIDIYISVIGFSINRNAEIKLAGAEAQKYQVFKNNL